MEIFAVYILVIIVAAIAVFTGDNENKNDKVYDRGVVIKREIDLEGKRYAYLQLSLVPNVVKVEVSSDVWSCYEIGDERLVECEVNNKTLEYKLMPSNAYTIVK